MITGIRLLQRNVISNAVGIVIPALAWVVVVPILVHCLGKQGYGVYTIAISFAGVIGFLELGLTSAAIKFISESEIRNNTEKLEKILSSNFSLYIILGGGITLLCLIFAPYIATLLFRDSGLDQEELSLVVRLVGIILTLTLLRNALSSVIMGFHRYDIYNAIQVSYAVALALVQGAIVIMGGQVVALMLGNIAAIAVGLIAFIFAIHHLIPKVRLLRLPDSYFLRALFSFGKYMMLISFVSAILLNVDKVIVGWVLGAESVTYYAVPAQIALKIHTGLAVFVSFIFPLASEVHSIGDKATLRKIYLQSMRFIILIDGLAMVFMGTFAREILAIWIDTGFAKVSAPILVFTSVGYLAFALSIVPYHILLGLGHPRELTMLNMLTTLCVISCLYAGLTWFGLRGGAIGAMIGMGTMVVLPWYTQRLLGIPWSTAFGDSYGYTIMCSISGIAISAILPPHFLIRLFFYVGFIVVLLVYGNTKRKDLQMIQNKLQQVFVNISVLTRSKRL